MFTGLIDDVGTIENVSATEVGRVLRVRCRYRDLAPGESIALNGACLTVREWGGDGWFAVGAPSPRRCPHDDRRMAGGAARQSRAGRACDAHFDAPHRAGHVDGIATVIASPPTAAIRAAATCAGRS